VRIASKRLDDLRSLRRVQYTDAFQRARERLRAAYVRVDQPPGPKSSEPLKALENLAWSGLKSSAPELHRCLPPREIAEVSGPQSARAMFGQV
jgi:hypothetical protein